MKCSISIPGLFPPDRNNYTGHVTEFSTNGKGTTYVYFPPTPTSTLLVCGRTIPCVIYMWWRREDPPPPLGLLTTQPFLNFGKILYFIYPWLFLIILPPTTNISYNMCCFFVYWIHHCVSLRFIIILLN